MGDYTVKRVEEVRDLFGEDYPGEMRMMTRDLGAEQVACTYRVIAAGSGLHTDPATAHKHETQEEIYFLISGRVQAKIGDDVVDVESPAAIRIAPQPFRQIRNTGEEDAVMLIVSTHGVDPREDATLDREFWKG